ncbi:hypothetical protein [Radiobacillus sp. PE A8.2]|uniref:hypothetical protein n=1 Tax=Radiobacillus sp. PE A8.2 TaxID=3380349 RepID=UPI00388EDAE3
MYAIIITENYQPVNMIRLKTESEAEFQYQKFKKQGCNVVKIKIYKAHELSVIRI